MEVILIQTTTGTQALSLKTLMLLCTHNVCVEAEGMHATGHMWRPMAKSVRLVLSTFSFHGRTHVAGLHCKDLYQQIHPTGLLFFFNEKCFAF